jgi:5-methylthioadenosine/S-adenosylhomocysteine deaminase
VIINQASDQSTQQSADAGDILIRNAAIVTMDEQLTELERGDILVRNGEIVSIAPTIDAADVGILDASGMIAIPGFVDSHRHMWEGLIRNSLPDGTLADYFAQVNGKFGAAYSPDDVYAGTLISALGAINAGVTTVLDWAHIQNSRDHTDSSVQALEDSGIRGVFGFGTPSALDAGHLYPHDITRLAREQFSSRDQLLTLALATDSPEYAPYDDVKASWEMARSVGARITAHAGIVGFGTPGQIERFGRDGLLGPDVTLVHCGALSDTEWRILADTGTTVSISAQIEMLMGHGSAPFQQALDVGIVPSLSVDVETSVPGDFFTHMRASLAAQRGAMFQRMHRGEIDAVQLIGVRDVLGMATMAGARANGLEEKVGSLSVGKRADIVLLRADSVNVLPVNDLVGAVVSGMDVSNVDTVLIDGRIKKRHGHLVGFDLNHIVETVYSARDRVFAKAGVPCGCSRHLGLRH